MAVTNAQEAARLKQQQQIQLQQQQKQMQQQQINSQQQKQQAAVSASQQQKAEAAKPKTTNTTTNPTNTGSTNGAGNVNVSGSYNSKYGQQLDGLLNQIMNPKKFTYDFNGDELFKYYADLYTQNGKQASMDAIGQASALTGGYGNSYAQQVGQQTYDEYLRNLYDKGMDFRNAAYQQYQDEQANLYNQYNTLYQTDQGEYTRWADQRDYNERVREFNENLDWQKMNAQQQYAAQYAMQVLANGQMPSAQLLGEAGLNPSDAQKMMAQLAAIGGGGGGGGGGSQTYYIDDYGVIFTNKNGKINLVDGTTLSPDTKLIPSNNRAGYEVAMEEMRAKEKKTSKNYQSAKSSSAKDLY